MKKSVAYIYLIKNTRDCTYKIGYSRSKPINRLSELQTGSSGKLELIDYVETNYGQLVERTIHNRYHLDNTNGEWFELPIQFEREFRPLCDLLESNFKALENSGNTRLFS